MDLGAHAVIGVGTDLVEVSRVARAIARRTGLVDRVFTADERAWCDAGVNPAMRYAARFAAKEAAMKALGVGLGGVGWHELEVQRAASGKPTLVVTGRAAQRASHLGGARWLVSMTHTSAIAHAIVVLTA